MEAVKPDDAKWIKSMHYDYYFKTDYESLKTDASILQCQINDISFIEDVNLSSMNADTRTMMCISLADVRKSLRDMNTKLNAMADIMLRHNHNLLNSIPVPPSETVRAKLDKKMKELKLKQTALGILKNGMSS